MKKIISILLAIITIVSAFTITSTSAYAASYTTNYNSYTAPTGNDYAYWNGKKTVKGKNTTASKIKWMQSSLNYSIKYRGLNASLLEVDGSFGPACKKATIAFQRKYNLDPDGSFGPGTISKMKSILSSSSSNTSNPSIIWPLANGAGKVSSKAGTKRSYETHAGTDIAAAKGTAILAIASGKVKACGYNSARGYFITIEHGDYLCVYQHMMSAAAVKQGATVRQGQTIGYVGSTGSSSGDHLHFEIALTSSLSKTGSVTNYIYNDVKAKKRITYYSASRGNKSGSYYALSLSRV